MMINRPAAPLPTELTRHVARGDLYEHTPVQSAVPATQRPIDTSRK